MGAILVLLTPIALVDSTSVVPTCIVPIIVLLAGRRPSLTTMMFIAGIFVAYFSVGLLIVFGMAALLDQLMVWLKDLWRSPNTLEVAIQIAIGVIMAAFAVKLADQKEQKRDRHPPVDVSPWGAFMFGGLFILGGIWGALPYFAAVDAILRADLSMIRGVAALFYYNIIVVAPLVVMVIVREILGERSSALFECLNAFFGRWTKRIIIWVLLLLGLFLVTDGVGWLAGMPILPMSPN